MVRDLLHSQLHELKDVLANQGLKVDRLDVNIQQQFGQSTTQSGDSSENGQWRTHIPSEDWGDEAAGRETIVMRAISF